VIENRWAMLKRKIATHEPISIGEQKSTLLEEWNNLKQKIIRDLAKSGPAKRQFYLVQ